MTTSSEILALLNTIDKKLDVHIAQQVNVEELVADHELRIKGNGKPGMEQRLKEIELRGKWITGVLVAIGTPAIGFYVVDLARKLMESVNK